MSYDKKDLEKKALAAIKRYRLKFITYVSAYLPCSRSTFSVLELDKSDTLKEAVEQNRTSAKTKALNRWEKSQNATLQVAFMKLIADDDEADRLNGSRQKLEATVKHSVDGETVELINKIYNGTGTIK